MSADLKTASLHEIARFMLIEGGRASGAEAFKLRLAEAFPTASPRQIEEARAYVVGILEMPSGILCPIAGLGSGSCREAA